MYKLKRHCIFNAKTESSALDLYTMSLEYNKFQRNDILLVDDMPCVIDEITEIPNRFMTELVVYGLLNHRKYIITTGEGGEYFTLRIPYFTEIIAEIRSISIPENKIGIEIPILGMVIYAELPKNEKMICEIVKRLCEKVCCVARVLYFDRYKIYHIYELI